MEVDIYYIQLNNKYFVRILSIVKVFAKIIYWKNQ